MNKNAAPQIITVVVLVLIIVLTFVLWKRSPTTVSETVNNPVATTEPASTTPVVTTVGYSCDAGKTITAVYSTGETKPAATPDSPPAPGGSVALTLSDRRTMTLPQTISADGTRYANADESFVFWGKGNGALVQENGAEKSYTGCILVAPAPADGSLPVVYSNKKAEFSLRLPSVPSKLGSDNYLVDKSYKYQALGPGKDIPGIKFTIPASMAQGTNLSKDSYVSVEQIPFDSAQGKPKVTDCSATLFAQEGTTAKTVTDGSTTYSVATTGDAGAGNRYNETIYAIPGTNPCVAVRYFVHYAVFENFPAGTVKEFDESALIKQFDSIRRTLVVNQ